MVALPRERSGYFGPPSQVYHSGAVFPPSPSPAAPPAPPGHPPSPTPPFQPIGLRFLCGGGRTRPRTKNVPSQAGGRSWGQGVGGANHALAKAAVQPGSHTRAGAGRVRAQPRHSACSLGLLSRFLPTRSSWAEVGGPLSVGLAGAWAPKSSAATDSRLGRGLGSTSAAKGWLAYRGQPTPPP